MKKRLNYYVLILFASLSLISIGFASWNIRDPNDRLFAVENNELTSEDVYNTSDYLSIVDNGIEISKFFVNGFYNPNGTGTKIEDFVSNVGYVNIEYQFKVSDLRSQYSDWKSVDISITLQEINSVFNNLQLFNKDKYFEVSPSCTIMNDSNDIIFNGLDVNMVSITTSHQEDNYSSTYNINLDLANLATYENLSIFISFKLEISNIINYTKDIYPKFANNTPNDMFSIISTLREGENSNEKE